MFHTGKICCKKLPDFKCLNLGQQKEGYFSIKFSTSTIFQCILCQSDNIFNFSDTKTAQYEDYRGVYAQQLIKTNRHQDDYYSRELCYIINKLEDVETEKIDFWKKTMKQCIDAELEVAPIINKCREDMKNVMNSVDHMVDNQIVIERLKTGDQPPRDLDFEEMSNGLEIKVGTLGRKKSKAKLSKVTEESSLFGKKRELEKQIEEMELNIEKGTIRCNFTLATDEYVLGKKEISALRLMVQSYTNNPKFGDASKFQSELDSAIYNVQVGINIFEKFKHYIFFKKLLF